jgi:acetyl esterase/lipase
MKHFIYLNRLTLLSGLFLIVALTTNSCKKDPEVGPVSDYVVSSTRVLTYPLQTIQAVVTFQLASYPEAADIVNRVKNGVEVYRINYKTHYRDSVITASGLACIPDVAGTYPVLSFQNGTNAYLPDAPSVNPSNQGYVVMEFMASNGYVVLMPDYIGFDASADILHPYYDRPSTDNAVIDFIKAFRELGESGKISATANDSLFLFGYSQGGGATISATESIENNNTTGMDVIAVSAGAGAYDLVAFTNYVLELNTFPAPMYFPYFIYSHQKLGSITGSLDLFFNQPYATDIPDLFDGTHRNADINNALSSNIDALLTPALINTFMTSDGYDQLRNVLSENSIHGWDTGLKISLYHGTADDNVPPSQSLNLYNEFIAAGADPEQVKHFPMEGLGHGSGLMPWGISTVNWFNSLR